MTILLLLLLLGQTNNEITGGSSWKVLEDSRSICTFSVPSSYEQPEGSRFIYDADKNVRVQIFSGSEGLDDARDRVRESLGRYGLRVVEQGPGKLLFRYSLGGRHVGYYQITTDDRITCSLQISVEDGREELETTLRLIAQSLQPK